MVNVKELNTKFPIKRKRYYVATDGKVYWKNAQGELKLMKPFTTKEGYIEYVLTCEDGTKQHIQAQIIVAATYKGYPIDETKTQVNHEDGVRSNNAVDNLKWVTPKQNIRHSFDKLGKTVWNAK